MNEDTMSRALLIGSPATGEHALPGVLGDVERMRARLEARGFACTLCAGEHATRQGILDALEQLCAQTRPGDAVVVYYAGHGGRASLVEHEGAEPG
ncbi:MAG: caspase family protein, partial [Myxococcales bacterium]|nr:caspase family protein [Myxococcales bacterium]